MKKQTKSIEEQVASILTKRKHPVAVPSLVSVSSPTLVYHGHLSPTHMKARKYDTSFASTAIFDQCFVSGQEEVVVVPGTILDSTEMMHVIEGPQGRGQRVQFLGVT